MSVGRFVRAKLVEVGRAVHLRLAMTKRYPFKYFKTIMRVRSGVVIVGTHSVLHS